MQMNATPPYHPPHGGYQNSQSYQMAEIVYKEIREWKQT